MNILYIVHPSEQHTATHAHTVEVIANLRKLGHTVSTVRVSKSPVYSTLSAQSKPLWVRVLSHTPVKWLYRELKGELALLYLAWVELGLIVRTDVALQRALWRKQKADVIYSRHRWLNLAEWLNSKRYRIPYIREINGFVADEMVVRKAGDRLSVWLFDRIERWNLRRGDRWIAVTTRIKVTLCEEYGVPKKKVAVVENGVNTELFRPMNEAQGDTIIFTGTVWRVQGLETLFRALPLTSARLTVIGYAEPPYRAELESLAESLGVRHRMAFIDKVPQGDIPHWIGMSDICIGPLTLAGRNERTGVSPMKLCEYMACEKPVVAAALPGLELVEKAEAGVLVEPDDHEALAEAINTLLGDANLRKRMGRNGREYVVSHRSWLKVAEELGYVLEGTQQ